MPSLARLQIVLALSIAAAACGDEDGSSDASTRSGGGQQRDGGGGAEAGSGGDRGGGAGDGAAPGGRDTDAGGDAGTASGGRAGGDPAGGNGGSGTGGDAGDPGSRRVRAFIAQGHVGRSTISCDDGRSWIAERSMDLEGPPELCDMVAPVTCFADGQNCRFVLDGDCVSSTDRCDCDHHPGAGSGIAYGDGMLVASWGWGPPGTVRRSSDGAEWAVVAAAEDYAGVAFGKGTFLLGSRRPLRSTDGGRTFQVMPLVDVGQDIWTARATGFTSDAGGRFIITFESDGASTARISSDGETFVAPTSLPDGCAASVLGVVAGEGAWLIVGRTGRVCVSNDGGNTFTEHQIALDADLTGSPVWTGERFVVWEPGKVHSSTDGKTWTAATLTPSGLVLGATAYAPDTGTFVAVLGVWQVWYENQRFYRSSDGVHWEELAADKYTGGHPIRHIVYGLVEPSEMCP